ncbi:c6 zinc finger domain containing protein [Grosmannia clavigera kw1407]|uniref:C6 zinc finger domain containing protein n=1 Tax=Grosmannia clavigera (strain kw1407 / UAMH 11150) TaxID=655863 RepID=F0XJ72_GROCL|nr:c6 zinc finger domain containing protein [Grosmannia clavigera kw1407]EFX02280.1 c6 zinc finger domain containing protein [Grosmannia clavigera kw1407]
MISSASSAGTPRLSSAHSPQSLSAGCATDSATSTRHALQQLLPTCQRCRRLRRRCDTQLPNCRPCQRAGAECTIFDHALKQTLPRAYVQSLLIRVEHLEAVKNNANGLTRSPAASVPIPIPTTATSPSTVSVGGSRPDRPDAHPATTDASFSPAFAPDSFDIVVPSAASAEKSRYWGASSVFALTVEILHNATARGFLTEAEAAGEDGGSQPASFADRYTQTSHAHTHTHADTEDSHHPSLVQAEVPPEADIRGLLQLYLVSANQLYGFVDPAQIAADLDVYLAVRRGGGGGGKQSSCAPSPHQVHPYFRIAMMCAIACATRSRYRPPRAAESLAYYADAAAYVEEVTAEVSPASLQALLLLIVFCLFYPRRGNVWNLLDYACRLTIELGYHTEGSDDEDEADEARRGERRWPRGDGPNDADNTGSQTEREAARTLCRSTFWGLYAIERIVGQLFGRGSDLPETVITAAYPSALAVAPLSVGAGGPVQTPAHVPVAMPDQPTLQAMSIAHHYRLVYLRSEIFRSLYLPAIPAADGYDPNRDSPEDNLLGPGLGLAWLRDRHHTLLAWRHELRDVGEDLAGVATITCDVGYDATMCFLFQPLLLRALRATAEKATTTTSSTSLPASGSAMHPLIIASDPFYSSIRLIRTYEKVIRAPEHSALGCYPMTFMSAHYIYLASSTLLSHALLRLDDRVHVLSPMGDAEAAPRRMSFETPLQQGNTTNAPGLHSFTELDWGAYVDTSSSWLILLAWCGERWPGLLGILQIYQRLFSRTIKLLIQMGIAK